MQVESEVNDYTSGGVFPWGIALFSSCKGPWSVPLTLTFEPSTRSLFLCSHSLLAVSKALSNCLLAFLQVFLCCVKRPGLENDLPQEQSRASSGVQSIISVHLTLGGKNGRFEQQEINRNARCDPLALTTAVKDLVCECLRTGHQQLELTDGLQFVCQCSGRWQTLCPKKLDN